MNTLGNILALNALWKRTLHGSDAARPQPVALSRGRVWSATLRSGTRVECRRGVVWLTLSDNSSDILLRAGEEFTVPKRGKVVAQALETASFSLVAQK